MAGAAHMGDDVVAVPFAVHRLGGLAHPPLSGLDGASMAPGPTA